MEILRRRFGQTVRQRLHHDRLVVVVVTFVLGCQGVGANPGGHREGAQVVQDAVALWRDVVGQGPIGSPVRLLTLLTQHVEADEL